MLFEIDAGKMSESEENLLNIISHYQRGLERCFVKQDGAKMLHKLERLYELPIKFSHLEETLVGQTVNSLRSLGGAVGEVAKSLVEKWQEIVIQKLDEESSDHESQNDCRILTNDDGQSSNTESSSESSESSNSESHSRSNSHERKQEQINEKISPENNYGGCSEFKNISKYSGKDCEIDKQKTVESEERLLKAIRRYQRDLDKHLLERNDSKMLQKLGRLNELPIEVCHLEQTLVGHTVNNLRILGGEVGMTAKCLVEKWQGTVVHAIENEDSDTEDYDVSEHREPQNASHINTNDRQISGTEDSSSEGHQSSESEGENQTISHEKKHEEGNEKTSHCSSKQNGDDHKVKENGCDENGDALKRNQMERKDLNSNVYIEEHHETGTESEKKSEDSIGNNRSEFENHESKKESKHKSKDKKKHDHKSSHHSKQQIHKNKITDKKNTDSSGRDKEKKKDHKERKSEDQKGSEYKKSVQSDKTSKRKPVISSSSNTTSGCTNTSSITTGSSKTSCNTSTITSSNTSITNNSSNTTTSTSITCSNDKKQKNVKRKPAPYTTIMHGVGTGSGFSFEDALGMLSGPPPSKKKKFQVKR